MTTTFDPQLDLVALEDVWPIEEASCDCPACTAANVQHAPRVVVCHPWQEPNGRWRSVGRRLHGFQLRQHLQARERFRRAAEAIQPADVKE